MFRTPPELPNAIGNLRGSRPAYRPVARALVGVAAVLLLVSPSYAEDRSPTGRSVDFTRDVRPILQARCAKCHGEKEPKSGLRLDVKAHALRGGDTGPVIVP